MGLIDTRLSRNIASVRLSYKFVDADFVNADNVVAKAARYCDGNLLAT